MNAIQRKATRRYDLLHRFAIYYIGFSLVPYALLFYLYVLYSRGPNHASLPKNELGEAMILVALVCLTGFFAMRHALKKIARLAEEIKGEALQNLDKTVIMELVRDQSEVGELARSFAQVFNRLETNIKELEGTRQTLYSVLTKVSNVLSSATNFDLLIRLILETTVQALGAAGGAIFSTGQENGPGRFVLKAWVGKQGVPDDEIVRAAEPLLSWVTRESGLVVRPALETGEEKQLFSPPAVCAPLLCRDRMWGALLIYGKASGQSFSENELQIVSNLSHQMAIAFENLQLNKDMEQAYIETISALAPAVEARDPYSRGHSERVGRYAERIGQVFGLSPSDVQTLRDACRLHDLGKIGISDTILNKPATLTGGERDLMKEHPIIGVTIVQPLKTFQHLLGPIRHHQEYLDGSGYPDGLKAEDISVPVRVMTVADIYDALTTDRPYRPALSPEETRSELDSMARNGKIDPEVLRCLFRLLDEGAICAPEKRNEVGQQAAAGG